MESMGDVTQLPFLAELTVITVEFIPPKVTLPSPRPWIHFPNAMVTQAYILSKTDFYVFIFMLNMPTLTVIPEKRIFEKDMLAGPGPSALRRPKRECCPKLEAILPED